MPRDTVELLQKWPDTGIQRDTKDMVRYRQDTGEIQAGDPNIHARGGLVA